MDMTEQLPDVVIISTIEAQIREMAQIEPLLSYLYAHRHGDMFKPVNETLPDIFQVMIPKDEVYLAIEPIKNAIPLVCTAETEVSEMKHYIIRPYNIVPISYDCLVHVMDVAEWTLAVVDYIRMVEVGIRCEEYPTCIKFVVHCHYLFVEYQSIGFTFSIFFHSVFAIIFFRVSFPISSARGSLI